MTRPSPQSCSSSPVGNPFRRKAVVVVTLLCISVRMVRNLFVYGRPFPPPFIFKEPPE